MNMFEYAKITKSYIIENSDLKRPIFLGDYEYLPFIYLLGILDGSKTNYRSFINSSSNKSNSKVLGSIVDKGVSKLQLHNITNLYHSQVTVSDTITGLTIDIKEYLDCNAEIAIPAVNELCSRTTYDILGTTLFSEYWKKFYLQSTKTIECGRGIMYHSENNEILMCIVFKRELLKYHKLYLLTENKFDIEHMEFWINEQIDTPQYEFKGIRKMYRTIIKPELERLCIPIVRRNVDSLRSSFKVPQESIAELNRWKEELYTNFLQKEKSSITYDFA